jgi:uncharacterized protein DUF3489
MKKTTEPQADTDVIGKALAHRQPRHRRMAREAAPTDVPPCAEPAPPKQTAPRAASKIAGVIALLKRGEGATLEELIQATGWLPHTTRAALTGLRKKGHVLAKDKRGEVTCYRIAEAGE